MRAEASMSLLRENKTAPCALNPPAGFFFFPPFALVSGGSLGSPPAPCRPRNLCAAINILVLGCAAPEVPAGIAGAAWYCGNTEPTAASGAPCASTHAPASRFAVLQFFFFFWWFSKGIIQGVKKIVAALKQVGCNLKSLRLIPHARLHLLRYVSCAEGSSL